MLQTLVQGGTAAAATVAFMPQNFQPQAAFASATETLPSGVTYEVIKDGTGPKPEIGELVAIRFSAYYGDKKIDDIFGTCVCMCVCDHVSRFQSFVLRSSLHNLSSLLALGVEVRSFWSALLSVRSCMITLLLVHLEVFFFYVH